MNSADSNVNESHSACRVLFEACTPLVYRNNSFRITGLPVDATTRDIKRRIDDLKHAEELGDADQEHVHAFALDPPPSLEHIRDAATRLQDPERRIVDEFFWFWPMEWGKGRQDPALVALLTGDKDSAFKIWSESLNDDHQTASVVAKHNLAVMYQLVALDSEHVALEADLSEEQLQTISKYWRRCFRWWEELTVEETFWSIIGDRIRMLDDPRLTTGFARRMRKTLPEAMDRINAMLAIRFAEAGKFSMASSHITYMKETHQGLDDVPKTLAVITTPLKTRVKTAVEKSVERAKRDPSKAAIAADDMLAAVKEPLQIIQLILPAHDHERVDLCDSVAEACLTCQVAYGRETEDWVKSLELLDKALKYAASHETKDRLSENRSTVAKNRLYGQYLEPLAERLKQVDQNYSIAAKVRQVESDVLPHLRTLERLPGMEDEVYVVCADMVANFLRGLSVATYNENSDLAAAIKILDLAISIARGSDTKEQFAKDKKQLATFKAEATKHNAHLQIRSDDIEITNDYVRYNSVRLPVSKIDGIKFGVFVQYTNGVKTSSSYLIDISGGQAGRISIECKRFFRSEEQAEKDYHQILESILHQVAPSVVQRLAEGIVAGRPLQMGECRLTSDGVYIPSGSLWWKKETLVPYSKLRFGNYQGSLSVSSADDSSISSSMALRDTWNAVFFEFIVKAVIAIKGKR